MSRPVVPLHTIYQWFAIPAELQSIILSAIKLRDRLWSWRLAKEVEKAQSPGPSEGKWVRCSKNCYQGWKLIKPREKGIHPSAMYSTCLRKIYYEAQGVQQQVMHEAKDLFIFDIGHAAHDMLQSCGTAGAWGERYTPEVSVGETPQAKELMIKGHADADNILVIDEIAGAPIFEVGIVHEYKTINDKGFAGLMNKPKPAHLQQATIYSACLDRPIVVYLYFNKDNANTLDFPIPFQPQIWDNMRSKAVLVRDAVLTNTPPQVDLGYHCKQCGYNYQCPEYQAKKKG